jgi:hypothetical protein
MPNKTAVFTISGYSVSLFATADGLRVTIQDGDGLGQNETFNNTVIAYSVIGVIHVMNKA